MKNITVLGSTGSIGVNALKLIAQNRDRYRAVALAAGKNIDLLLRQIKEFRPAAVSVQDESLAKKLKRSVPTQEMPEIFFGSHGAVRLATLDEADTVISAITGAAGLLPTYEAIKAGKQIALANKETMVMAGDLVMTVAAKMGVSVLPIDSEHSAILQSLQGHPKEDLLRIILTASGGPFRDLSLKQMANVTRDEALNHPNWSMGPKISIDSATMMNKGLETIEAKWLFDLKMEQIGILIHPQSIVHSMAEYKDGSIIAQMGVPDMLIPIAYSLSFPHHNGNGLPHLNLEEIGTLTFEKPDLNRFRCLDLALKAAAEGQSMQTVLNGANEIAVDAFLKRRIRFLDIPVVIEKTMGSHITHRLEDVEMVIEADRWAREKAEVLVSSYQ